MRTEDARPPTCWNLPYHRDTRLTFIPSRPPHEFDIGETENNHLLCRKPPESKPPYPASTPELLEHGERRQAYPEISSRATGVTNFRTLACFTGISSRSKPFHEQSHPPKHKN
ncbi:Uncharacterized protein Rs2_15093 [Raphanus sativus]|nr:Uncharacterized protein Rs2_15093 [Raphanus sativus]